MSEEGLWAGRQGGMHVDCMKKVFHGVMEGCEHASGHVCVCACMHEWDEGMRSHILPVSHQQAPQTLLSRPSHAIPTLPFAISEFLCADDLILLPPVSASAHHVSYSFVGCNLVGRQANFTSARNTYLGVFRGESGHGTTFAMESTSVGSFVYLAHSFCQRLRSNFGI